MGTDTTRKRAFAAAFLSLLSAFGTHALAQTQSPSIQEQPILGEADKDIPDTPVEPLVLNPYCPYWRLDGTQICPNVVAVIGGLRAYARDAPWQAQISTTYAASAYSAATLRQFKLWQLNHVCGGSLIADDWIVTAAHCVAGRSFDPRKTVVRLGATDISVDDGRVFPIVRVISHSGYDPETELNDIALIQIAHSGTFTRERDANIAVIALHGSIREGPRLLPWQNFVATGWGVTSTGPEGRSPALLQRLSFERVPNNFCAQALKAPDKINDSVLCAISKVGDTCQGDSGGPLSVASGEEGGSFSLSRPVLVGIVSWGKGCAIEGNPGVYTRISAHLNWIRQAMASAPNVRRLP